MIKNTSYYTKIYAYKIVSLFISILFFLSSCVYNNNNTTNTLDTKTVKNDLDKIDNIFNNKQSEVLHFEVPSDTISQINGLKGISILVDPEALETIDGNAIKGNINVEIIEATNKFDFIKNNIQTISNGEMLISGGAYYISMTSNGLQVKIKENKYIELELPKLNNDSMELFFGERDDIGNMNWVKAKEPFKSKDNTNKKRHTTWLEKPSIPKKPIYNLNLNDVNCTIINIYEDSITKRTTIQKTTKEDSIKYALEYKEKYDEYLRQKSEFDNWCTENKYYIETYNKIKISNLGWINCDRFYNNLNPKIEIALNVKNEAIKIARVYIVFEEINSLLQANYCSNQNDNMVLFRNIPAGEKIRVIALSEIDLIPQVFDKELITVENESINLDFKETTIEDIGNKYFGDSKIIKQIYPNPTSNNCNIELNITGDYILELLDNSSKILTRDKFSSNATKIDISMFPAGVYYVRIFNQKDFRFDVEKIIKQ